MVSWERRSALALHPPRTKGRERERELAMSDPIFYEPELWRCKGCNQYFHPDKYDWHVDEECKKLLEEESKE